MPNNAMNNRFNVDIAGKILSNLPREAQSNVSLTSHSAWRMFGAHQMLSGLLNHVVNSSLEKAEKICRQHPECMYKRTDVVDLAGRQFYISPFEYAVWALDQPMWRMMLRCIPEGKAGLDILNTLLLSYNTLMREGVTYQLHKETIKEQHYILSYTMCLKAENTVIEPGILYFDRKQGVVQYTVITPSGKIATAEFESTQPLSESLNSLSKEDLDLLARDRLCLYETTAKRGHTHPLLPVGNALKIYNSLLILNPDYSLHDNYWKTVVGLAQRMMPFSLLRTFYKENSDRDYLKYIKSLLRMLGDEMALLQINDRYERSYPSMYEHGDVFGWLELTSKGTCISVERMRASLVQYVEENLTDLMNLYSKRKSSIGALQNTLLKMIETKQTELQQENTILCVCK